MRSTPTARHESSESQVLNAADNFKAVRMVGNLETIQKEIQGNECGAASEFVDFFQPTTQPTRTSVLYDFRVVWQSPRFCKLL